MKPRLVITFPVPEPVLENAKKNCEVTSVIQEEMNPAEIIQSATKVQAEALLVSASQKIDADLIRALPKSLKVIATSSVGFDHLDRICARDRGIQMTNTPDVLTDCTADFALMMILSACRRAPEYQDVMKKGWGIRLGQNQLLGIQVTGKTLGILGMGRIGRAVAHRARSFGMKIAYCNPRRLPPELEQHATYFSDFKEMLPDCHILSLHAPANESTKNIMNLENFYRLPKGAVFVNTARGSLVDEQALIQVIEEGHLFSAGLDVFQNEPNFNKKLLEYKNIVLAPHMGSATVETRTAMGLRALGNALSVLAGRGPIDPVN